MSDKNESCHIAMIYATHLDVAHKKGLAYGHNNSESCHARISHVTQERVMAHVGESWHTTHNKGVADRNNSSGYGDNDLVEFAEAFEQPYHSPHTYQPVLQCVAEAERVSMLQCLSVAACCSVCLLQSAVSCCGVL